MSNVFNFNRLCALIRRQWIAVGKIYMMSIVIIAGIFIAFYGFSIFNNYGDISTHSEMGRYVLNFRQPLFYFLGLFFITIISSSYFSDLGQKTKAIFELMIPASRLEKFLSAVFYTAIVSLSAYFLLFFLVDLAFVSYLRSIGSSITTIQMEPRGQVVVDNWMYFFKMEKSEFFPYFYFLPFILNALFLLGSIAYQNYQYIKTAITMIIYIAVWIITFIYVMKLTTDNTIGIDNNNYFDEKVHSLQLVLAIGIFLTLIFWGLAFLKLKEKEV
jgi:heme/copper-type cytochrome/quinol oxidase subunit 2